MPKWIPARLTEKGEWIWTKSIIHHFDNAVHHGIPGVYEQSYFFHQSFSLGNE